MLNDSSREAEVLVRGTVGGKPFVVERAIKVRWKHMDKLAMQTTKYMLSALVGLTSLHPCI